MRIGICLWSISKDTFEAMEIANELGFDTVALNLVTEADAIPLASEEYQQKVINYAEKLGLEIVCIGVNGLCDYGMSKTEHEGKAKEIMDAALVAAKNMGIKYLQIPSFGKGRINNQEELEHTIKCLQYVVYRAEIAGVMVGYESSLNIEQNLYVMDKVRSDNFFVFYDGANLVMDNTEDPIEFVNKLCPYISQVHIKNPSIENKGEGAGEYCEITKRCTKALLKNNFNGIMLIENNYKHLENKEEIITRDVQLIKQYISEI